MWRHNVIGMSVRGNKVYAKRGVPDIIGYEKSTGIATYVEIKVARDKLNAHQRLFLLDAVENGCIAFVIGDEQELARIQTANHTAPRALFRKMMRESIDKYSNKKSYLYAV